MWRRVRRSILSGNVVTGFSDGSVKGWLPANKSDYVSEKSGRLSALWHGTLAERAVCIRLQPILSGGFGDVGCPAGWAWLAARGIGWLAGAEPPYPRNGRAYISRQPPHSSH